MEEAINDEFKDLTKAIHYWTGWGTSPMPNRDDAKVLEYFGKTEGEALLIKIKNLENDFYLSDAYISSVDMIDMAKKASDDFKLMHPEIPEGINKVLAWCYTFDWR